MLILNPLKYFAAAIISLAILTSVGSCKQAKVTPQSEVSDIPEDQKPGWLKSMEKNETSVKVPPSSYEFEGLIFKKSPYGYSHLDTTKNIRIDARPQHVHTTRFFSDASASKLEFYNKKKKVEHSYNLLADHPYRDYMKKKTKNGRSWAREKMGMTQAVHRGVFDKLDEYFVYAEVYTSNLTDNVVAQQVIYGQKDKKIMNCLSTLMGYNASGELVGKVKDIYGQIAYPVLSKNEKLLVYLKDSRPAHGSRLVIYDFDKNEEVYSEPKADYNNTALAQDKDSDLLLIGVKDLNCAKRYKVIDIHKRVILEKCFTKEEWDKTLKDFVTNSWTASDIIANHKFESTKF